MTGILYVTIEFEDIIPKIIVSLIFVTVCLINFHNTDRRIRDQFELIETNLRQVHTMKTILKKMTIPILILNKSNEIEYVNERFAKQFRRNIDFRIKFSGTFKSV